MWLKSSNIQMGVGRVVCGAGVLNWGGLRRCDTVRDSSVECAYFIFRSVRIVNAARSKRFLYGRVGGGDCVAQYALKGLAHLLGR